MTTHISCRTRGNHFIPVGKMLFSIWEQGLLLRGYIFPLATCSCRLHWATVCLFTDQWQWRESQVHCGLVPFPSFSWQMLSTKTAVNNPHSKCLAAQAFTEIASSFFSLSIELQVCLNCLSMPSMG